MAILSLFKAVVRLALYVASSDCFCSDSQRSRSAQANERRRGVHTLYALKHLVNLVLTAPNRASDFSLWVASFKSFRSSMAFAASVSAVTPADRVLESKLASYNSYAFSKVNSNLLVEGNELGRALLIVFGEIVCKILTDGDKDEGLQIERPLDFRGHLNEIK